MKKEFKHHIKHGSCWYDTFFKISTRQVQNKQIITKSSNAKNLEGEKKRKENEHTK